MTKFRLKNALAFLTLGTLFICLGCGGPQELPPPDGTTHNNETNTVKNDCSFGAGGTDSNGDLLSDACADKLGIKTADPDCDHDGIPNGMDNPADCSGKDPSECDEFCQQNRDRAAAMIADSLAMGAYGFGGRAVNGIHAVIQRKFVVFRNDNQKLDLETPQKDLGITNRTLTESLCKAQNGGDFYLYVVGDLTYTDFIDKGVVQLPRTVNNVNFELCGSIDFNPNNPSSSPYTIHAKLLGSTAGPVSVGALYNPNEAKPAQISFKSFVPLSYQSNSKCPSTPSINILNQTMTTEVTEAVMGNEFSITSKDINGNPIDLGKGTYSIDKLSQKWKRYKQQFNCDRITNHLFGVAGYWINN